MLIEMGVGRTGNASGVFSPTVSVAGGARGPKASSSDQDDYYKGGDGDGGSFVLKSIIGSMVSSIM